MNNHLFSPAIWYHSKFFPSGLSCSSAPEDPGLECPHYGVLDTAKPHLEGGILTLYVPVSFASLSLVPHSILSHPLGGPTLSWNVCQLLSEGPRATLELESITYCFLPCRKGGNHATFSRVIENRLLQLWSQVGKMSSVHFQIGVGVAGKTAAQSLNRADKQQKKSLDFFLLSFVIFKGQ